MKRFAYIKNSDVVAEVETYCTQEISEISNGPLNYIINFLKWAGKTRTAVVSFDSLNNRGRAFEHGNLSAKTYPRVSKYKYLNNQLSNPFKLLLFK